MNSFWRATLRWTICIFLLMFCLAALAALVGPIAGVNIFGNNLRGPIKAISGDVFLLGIGVSAWVDAARGRLFGPARLRPNLAGRYLLQWARHVVLWVMPLVWIGCAANIVRSITLVAFGERAVTLAVNATIITAIPVVIFVAYRFLKKYPLQQPNLISD